MLKLITTLIAGLTCAALLGLCQIGQAQLRVVTYNTRTNPSLSSLSIVLEAIGEESVNGISQPIDVLLLQEQSSPSGTTQDILDELDTIYGPGIYARGNYSGTPSSSSLRQGIIYNTQSVQLISEAGVGSPTGLGIPRQPIRYQLRPVGYDSSADLHIFNSHYKASTGAANEATRLIEAETIRLQSDFLLGEGSSVIYAGDFNMQSSSEDAFQELLSAGAGQAFDPVNQLGNWHTNSNFAEWHTQSPCEFSCSGGFAGGGVDDRFDFQLVTGELLDNEGISYISGSYHTFGNNGSTYNDAINVGNTISLNGVTSFTTSTVLNALENATDHLPVVADYQLPAVLGTSVATIPSTLLEGETFDLDVSIFNDANVLAVIGADELDYSISISGDISSLDALSGMDQALGGSNLHEFLFDTSSIGMKTAEIMISSSSQSAANNMVSIPISFEVVADGIDGDFNNDGVVDAADYTVWRDNLGNPDESLISNNGNGVNGVDPGDYGFWYINYGNTASSSASSAAIPEPTSGMILAGMILGFATVAGRTRC